MRAAPALVPLLAAASLAAPTAALAAEAPEYSFPDSCSGDQIYTTDADCVDGWIDIAMHADGSVTWMRETAYPRAAFDEFLAAYMSWDGTTEEFLDTELEDADDETMTTSYELTDDLMTVRVTTELAADAEASEVGFALEEDGTLTAAIPIAQVTGVSLVTLDAPGTVSEANGAIDGASVTWTTDTMADLTELDVTASSVTETSSSAPSWLVPTGITLVVLLAVAVFFGFIRKPRDLDEE